MLDSRVNHWTVNHLSLFLNKRLMTNDEEQRTNDKGRRTNV